MDSKKNARRFIRTVGTERSFLFLMSIRLTPATHPKESVGGNKGP